MATNLYPSDNVDDAALAPKPSALQQLGPRPLPLFLALLDKFRKSDPMRAEKALSGLRKLQRVTLFPTQIAAPVVAQHGGAALHDYGGAGRAVVFVPSLINPATILDIIPQRSLLRWLATQGFRSLLVDWGEDAHARTALGLGDHVTERLIPLLRTLDEPPHLVGYCLGGSLALAAAQLTPVKSLALIAAPWRFSGYPDDQRAAMQQTWTTSRAAAEYFGVLPIEVLQTLFWQLDPDGTIDKYAAFADMPETGLAAELFIAMERWANSGAPLPLAATRELFEDLISSDTSGEGRWRVGGSVIQPQNITCPALEIVSTIDRIAPAATATGHFARLEIDRGHVGMITGSQAKVKLWQPLREWLSSHAKSG